MPSTIVLALRTASPQGSRINRDTIVGVVLLILLVVILAATFFVWCRRRARRSDEEMSRGLGDFDVDSPAVTTPAQVQAPTLASLPEAHFRVPFPPPRLVPGPRRPIISPQDRLAQRNPGYTQPSSRPDLKLLTTPEVLKPPSRLRHSSIYPRPGSGMNTPALPSSVWKSEAQDRWVRATQILRSPLRGRGAAPSNPVGKKKIEMREKNRVPPATGSKGVGGGATRKLNILIPDMQERL